MTSVKRTVHKAAREEKKAAAALAKTRDAKTADNFQNFALNLGLGTDNGLSGGTYGFNPVSRIRVLLEWIYRGSWLGGVAVDLVADDMSRAGIEISSSLPPDAETKINSAAVRLDIWGSLGDTVRWSRLYGGAIAVLMIEGQKLDTPLRIETVSKGQFKGLFVLDRWMLDPSLNDIVSEPGPDLGQPKFYKVIADAPAWRQENIHHTRVIKLDGIRMPYWQRINENFWGISVIERLYDRMIAFDSATMGAAQLVYKSFLRTLKLDNFREAAAAGGDALAGIVAQVNTMRRFQSQEGITLIDGKDDLQVDQSNVQSGISDALVQFAQQLSGALQIPLVRLFGQSPAGLNSTGESDLRTYYDNIKAQQERWLRVGVSKIYRCIAMSVGVKLDEEFEFEFRSLWQLTEEARANIANTVSTAIINAKDAGIIDAPTAMKELKQSARETGVFSTITDEDIQDAIDNPPEMNELAPPEGGAEDPAQEEHQSGAAPAQLLRPRSQSPEPASMKATDRALDYGGLEVQIETPKGTSRPGHDCIMAAHYGYIRGTRGADGDCVDCFLGPLRDSKSVWVIDQKHTDGSFDEHKVMLGFDTFPTALAAYTGSFHAEEGMDYYGGVKKMSLDEFKRWLERSHLNVAAE